MHLLITDSGLGGLSICAGIEQWLRRAGHGRWVRLTYVNAWPREGRGYNDLPDLAARAAAFDRTLAAIDALCPDRVVIACNTLSIVYEHTAHRRGAHVPVRGIVEAGVATFAEALHGDPKSALVLLGTRTTIDSGVYVERLVADGISPARVAGVSCHGLATAIERGPTSDATARLVETCARQAAAVRPGGEPLLVGLCCTHYGMVSERLRAAIQARTGGTVEVFDPNARLVADVAEEVVRGLQPGREAPPPGRASWRTGRRDTPEPGGGGRPAHLAAAPVVRMLSKVALPDEQREAVAALLEDVSPATAAALRACEHVPDLF